MKTRALTAFAVLLLSVCSACTLSAYKLIKPQRYQVSDFYSVESQINWSRASSWVMKGEVAELWTVDGALLEAVRFFDGVRADQSLFSDFGRTKNLPKFRATMTPTEIQELVVDTMAKVGYGNVRASNLRPFKFGASPGFRFDLELLSADGLELLGIAAGTTSKDRLYLILYTGTRSYYFDKYKGEVERMLESIQTTV